MVRYASATCGAILALLPSARGDFGFAKSYLLDDEPEDGARCLDGTPPRFWLQQAPEGRNSTKWSFHLAGGGDCTSFHDCADRAYNPAECHLGSSSVQCYNSNAEAHVPFAEVMRFEDIAACNGGRWCGGLMSRDPVRNPLTHDWNKVLAPYCDGGMWMGNNGSVSQGIYGGPLPLYFRGMRNAVGVLSRLLRDHGLAQGTDLVLSGDSAGGMGTLVLADRFSELLKPYSVRVSAVPDHGYFTEEKVKLEHGYDWRGILRWTYGAMNGTVDQSCTEDALATGKDPAEHCTLPETSTPYVTTPLFLVNSKYDPSWEASEGITQAETNAMGEALVRLIKDTALNRPGNAAFLTSCDEHCGQWSQNYHDAWNTDFQVFIDGDSAATAVNAWYGGFASKNLWLQPDTFPCETCCNMTPPPEPPLVVLED